MQQKVIEIEHEKFEISKKLCLVQSECDKLKLEAAARTEGHIASTLAVQESQRLQSENEQLDTKNKEISAKNESLQRKLTALQQLYKELELEKELTNTYFHNLMSVLEEENMIQLECSMNMMTQEIQYQNIIKEQQERIMQLNTLNTTYNEKKHQKYIERVNTFMISLQDTKAKIYTKLANIKAFVSEIQHSATAARAPPVPRVHAGKDLKTRQQLKNSYCWYTEIPVHTWIQLFNFPAARTHEEYTKEIVDLYMENNSESAQCKVYNTYTLVEYVQEGHQEAPTLSQGGTMALVDLARITDEITRKKDDYHVEHSSDNKDFINYIGKNVLQRDPGKQTKLIAEIAKYFKDAPEKRNLCNQYTQASDTDKLRLYFGELPVDLGMITTRLHVEERMRFFLYLLLYKEEKEYFDFDSREHPRFVNMKYYTEKRLNLDKGDCFQGHIKLYHLAEYTTTFHIQNAQLFDISDDTEQIHDISVQKNIRKILDINNNLLNDIIRSLDKKTNNSDTRRHTHRKTAALR